MPVAPVLARLTARSAWPLIAVFVVAAAVRIGLVLSSRGGLGGDLGYDPAVYYSAADALVHGRLPYRDFVLLHPPGLMLVLAPFAALGAVTSDHVGYVSANVAFELLGAVNAVLVVVAARRHGLGRGAATVAGMFYAVWFGAAHPEVSIRLEPLGTCAFLLALIALSGTPARGRVLLGGIALGFATAVKIWWIAPAAVVVCWWLLRRRSRSSASFLLGGAAAALVVVDGPFLLAAPSVMWRMVVTDQLGRQRGMPAAARLSWLTSASDGAHPGTVRDVVSVLLLILAAAVIVLAARQPAARLFVAIAAVQLVVLVSSPSFFTYYSGYLAAPVALVVGAAASRPLRRATVTRAVTGGSLLAVACVTAAVIVTGSPTISSPFPRAAVTAAVRHARCVQTDAPIALIEADVLSRDLRNGCPNWVDVTGRTYDVDASRGSHYVQRSRNGRWQRDLRRYLLSGQAVILMRPSTGIGPGLRRELAGSLHSDHDGVRTYLLRRTDDADLDADADALVKGP